MVCDERLASFINSFNTDYDEVVTSIRREAEENRVPIIRREAGEFIKMLILMNRPKKILEIGSAIGFSAIFMSRFLDDDAHINNYRELSAENRRGEEEYSQSRGFRQDLLCLRAMHWRYYQR